MALTADEQELYDIARKALPWWYAPLDAVNEQLYAKAKIIGGSLSIDKNWLATQAYILTADGPTATTADWLGEHARDRGTSRRSGESDTVLRARIREVEEALHRQSLLDAAQALLTAAGVAGAPALVELPRDAAYFGQNQPVTGTGGTFATVSGSVRKFTPTVAFTRPPYDVSETGVTWKLVISGAANAGNNGTFTITGIDVNGAKFTNASGVNGADATVSWRLDRYSADGALMTVGSAAAKSFFGRGFRMSPGKPCVVVMLPYGTSETLRLAVFESLRQRKAAGVFLVVERRLNP